jgi:hypothetical protein
MVIVAFAAPFEAMTDTVQPKVLFGTVVPVALMTAA